MLDQKLKQKIIQAQKNEISEYLIYKLLAKSFRKKDIKRAEVLEKISKEELVHHNFWASLTNQTTSPDRLKVYFYLFIAKIFGLTFGLKLMEKDEDTCQDTYEKVKFLSPEIEKIIGDEKTHENQLIDLIDEERLKYISSVVLGLNDALVELTGALVGFSLALQNARLVGIVGLITGIAASLSMAASEYLSTKEEDTSKNPLKASFYTGLAYIGAVVLLITPYLVFQNVFICLGLVLFVVIAIVCIFTYYISIAKELNFKKKFLEMAAISLTVAIINFIIGIAIRNIFGIEI